MNNETINPIEIFFFQYDKETFINLNNDVLNDINYWIEQYKKKNDDIIIRNKRKNILKQLKIYKTKIEQYNRSIPNIFYNCESEDSYMNKDLINKKEKLTMIYNFIEDIKQKLIDLNLYDVFNENEYNVVMK